MTPLIHNYSRFANQTVYWDTSDNESRYLQNIKNSKYKKQLEDLGFLDTQILYKFNSHGFRTEEFSQQIDVVCFGCSFTMGTGVHSRDTWPAQLQALTGMVVANLGHAGSSNDTAFRFAEHYLKFVKPKYAVWLQTDMHRLELLNDNNNTSLNIISGDKSNPCANDYFVKTWFSSDSNQRFNLIKNTLAFKQICDNLKIKYIILPRNRIPSHALLPNTLARDLMHPGKEIYKQLSLEIKDLLVNV